MHTRLIEGALYCGHCGGLIHGNPPHCIHRDGPSDGPEVPLCRRCGGPSVSCTQIWARISRHTTHAPDRSLN